MYDSGQMMTRGPPPIYLQQLPLGPLGNSIAAGELQ